MTNEELISALAQASPQSRGIVLGMLLILRYESDAEIAAEDDIIYFGNASTLEEMKPEERDFMKTQG